MFSPQKEHLWLCAVSLQDSSSPGRGHLQSRLPAETVFFMHQVGPQQENRERLRQRRWNSASESNVLAWGEIWRGLTDSHKWKQRGKVYNCNHAWMRLSIFIKKKTWTESACKIVTCRSVMWAAANSLAQQLVRLVSHRSISSFFLPPPQRLGL